MTLESFSFIGRKILGLVTPYFKSSGFVDFCWAERFVHGAGNNP
jgi:hypothetical protein